MCPTLGGAKAATHTENDGQQRRLLQMDGLVPINYRGATYNIPVHIWVEPDYPSRPVRPYVVPVQGMMIVPGHQHVGADGCCYFPYLNAWNPQTSNIAALVAEIQAAFSAHPPVVSGTEAPAPAPAPVPVPAPAPAYQYQPAPVPAPAPHNRAKDDAAQVVAQQVQARASEQGTALQDELSGLMEQQQVLQAGKQAIDHGLQELRTEKEQLSKRLEWLLDKNTEMTQWLRDNPADELDPDSIVVPKDNQSRQLLELEAEDHAIDDTIYELAKAYERAVQSGGPEANGALTTYLRHVRTLANRQFKVKALKIKIAARRGQA